MSLSNILCYLLIMSIVYCFVSSFKIYREPCDVALEVYSRETSPGAGRLTQKEATAQTAAIHIAAAILAWKLRHMPPCVSAAVHNSHCVL